MTNNQLQNLNDIMHEHYCKKNFITGRMVS